ncbi:2-polyprenyl-3-methyl-5-hydroxy-6-metoxy-1,4-benzoquinol methylase [Hydrogenophaga palleronii]|uniref:2-polyprenyl-3-methyl-5-hydroxy-6-metoxy-1, 4-benzoquinol methylase n=1 Tax=Hydrogenophaga palleronii TaxID=65655 RepID=A0ABU1WGA2_9BURK|nr:rhamnan synthesis F family protein [Hydrogenophaga palleronii]MDR7148301.1 2-polyprenyl-3-methyl-5-hydroxy-6-metoxy-1,4-benzoquinol methylase [Hydrogenophaga palleronii]
MNPESMAPYQFNEDTRIWSRPGYGGITYNDGDEIEQRLLSIISAAQDRSVLSPELKSHCTDWASTYHLSGSRANILRPFEPHLKGKVLEIGAGCGAITRYMGECGADVLALEGTLRRATIARARTNDLENVTVLAESFSAFETDEKFDVVTLIGVLEYASMFVQAERPDVAMLTRARQLLKPTGRLIIAIENQLGLKYFAGAPEDHVGIPSFGLEDRYLPNGVRTYGRHAIDALLKSTGFSSNRFFAPFPDYKFPVSIVSEKGFESSEFDASALAIQSVRRDPQLPATLAFQPERTWQSLFENRIALDLSNSFLISAHTEPTNDAEPTLAWHFSTERRADLCKVTQFLETDTKQVLVSAFRPRKDANPQVSIDGLTNRLEASTEYVRGKTLSTELLDIVTREGWTDEAIAGFIHRYFHAVSEAIGTPIQAENLFDETISGRFIDALPQNIMCREDGQFQLIDTEWAWDKNISSGYLLFRGLHTFSLSLTRIGSHAKRSISTHADFLHACFASINCPLDSDRLADFCLLESELQHRVNILNQRPDYIFRALTESGIGHANVWETIASERRQNSELVHEFENLRNFSVPLEQVPDISSDAPRKAAEIVGHAHALVNELRRQVTDRDDLLQMILRSRSWTLTKPFRFLTRSLARLQLAEAAKASLAHLAKMKHHFKHATTKPNRLFVCIHAYYPEMLPGMLERVKSLPLPAKILVTTSEEHQNIVKSCAKALDLEVEVLPVENKGRDILPFLIAMSQAQPRDLVLKIHTKKSPHRSDGESWRNDMLDKLLSPSMVERVFRAFGQNANLGMVAPEGHVLSIDKYMGQNRERFQSLLNRMPTTLIAREASLFSGGTMFYVRPSAMEPLMALGLNQSDFESEGQQVDGTMAHAVERLMGASVTAAGFYLATTTDPSTAAKESTCGFHPL